MRPRVLLVPYTPNWTYASTARALARHLSDWFEFRIAYDKQDSLDDLEQWRPDLVVDFWWRGTLGKRFGGRVIKQISSHRWSATKWGALTPRQLLEQHGDGVIAYAVPSVRLQRVLRAVSLPAVAPAPFMLCPKGFEPKELSDHGMRRGPIVVGWAGNAFSSDKGVKILLAAEPGIRLADRCLTAGEMGDFYNGLDVLAIASEAEGDPRTLIEGMACGCYPVTTDVGIVPELVQHRQNGLIVSRGVEYFRDAFADCRARAAQVRAAGALNATATAAMRSWSLIAPLWARAFDYALSKCGAARRDTSRLEVAP